MASNHRETHQIPTISQILQFLLPFYIVISISSALQISKSTKIDIRVYEGESYDLTCTVDEAWDFCKWTHSGQTCFLNSNDEKGKECHELRGPSDNERVFNYQEDETSCNIRISNAIPFDAGDWTCRIFKDSDSVEATIQTTVYSPTRLEFKTRPHRRLSEGKTFKTLKYLFW